MLAACSDGGSSGGSTLPPPPPPPPPPGGTGPTWTEGVFEPASRFKDRCEVVRTGVDIEGNPFPDMPGSMLEEMFWLRSWTHETYLWNDEVIDRNPADFGDRLEYFALLRTFATTLSGRDKDEFHFTIPTDEFLRQRNSTPRAEYGAELAIFSATPPRDVRVLYTEPGSPAAEVVGGQINLPRGTRILEVDGVDLVNANTQAEIDILNNGLFPATAGEQHTFVVRDAGAASTRTVTLISENIAPKPVNLTSVVDTPGGKVGYMLLTTFSPFASEKDIADAIAAMRADGVQDLVLDLRYNSGGLLAVASQLGYMIAGEARTSGRVFERLRFNDDAGDLNPVTGQFNEPVPFFDEGLGFSLPAGQPLQSLDLPRVFILSTEITCSASEAVLNALRGIDLEVVLIGGATCGKPFGFFPQDNCGVTYFTIQFQGVNDKGFGDYADGFSPENSSAAFAVKVPGCEISDDLGSALGDENEPMFAAALAYRETGACPTSAMAFSASSSSVKESGASPMLPGRSVFETNRDMRMPN
ncbi:Peptidase family S41 [Amphiplicatus metriothermophilus]|uniref:Peptidase family S41 n=1 Tax=Amphiplicatus metriothermophilus TaxID=1519374 RepID=A0A239PV07_9PROT|nr:Peptidase family S41 [Amphiplicatus metriothermophilus]